MDELGDYYGVYKVTFYFVSGLNRDIYFLGFEWEDIKSNLKKYKWNESDITNMYFGLSFANVTHYSVDVVEAEDQVKN